MLEGELLQQNHFYFLDINTPSYSFAQQRDSSEKEIIKKKIQSNWIVLIKVGNFLREEGSFIFPIKLS